MRSKLVPIQATIVDRVAVSRGFVQVQCTAPARFDPGDVVAIRVGGSTLGPAGTWRRYTVADSADQHFRLLIEHNPLGAAAAFLDSLEVGGNVAVRGPEAAVLPPEGTGPIVVIADLTGLATISAVIARARQVSPSDRVEVVVMTADVSMDRTAVAACIGTAPDELVVYRHLDEVVEWINRRCQDCGGGLRLLAVGGHDLATISRRTAIATGAPSVALRTRTYWKQGRRGLE